MSRESQINKLRENGLLDEATSEKAEDLIGALREDSKKLRKEINKIRAIKGKTLI